MILLLSRKGVPYDKTCFKLFPTTLKKVFREVKIMKIDFVVTWVDNNDVEWRTTKNFYAGLSSNIQEGARGGI